MPLSKQYLRYEHAATLGVVNGRKSNLLLTEAAAGSKRRALVVAPAVEDVIVWDPRRGDKAAVLRGTEKQEVCCLCMSRDGRLLAAGCQEGTIRLWDMTSHHSLVSFSGHKSSVTCLQFDCSGTRLVSGSKDTNVIVWDVVGECGLYRLRGHKGPITGCRLLTHSNVLITSSKDSLVKLWDMDTQHCFQTLVGHKSEVWGLEIVSEETRLLTACSDQELLMFQLSQQKAEEGGGEREGEGERGRGKRKAEASEEDTSTVKAPLNCQPVGTLKRHSNRRILHMKADPSGRLVGCLSAAVLEVFMVRSKEERDKVVKRKRRKAQKRSVKEGATPVEESEVLTADEEIPHSASLSGKSKLRSFDILPQTGSKMLVALGLHSNSIELHMLDMLTTPPTTTFISSLSAPGHPTDIRTVCFSSDDSYIASGSDKMIKVWSRASNHCLHTMLSRYVLCTTFVPGDRHILAGTKDGHLQLFDLGSGELLQDISAHSGAVWSVDVSPDKHGVVTGSADHNVKFWDFELVSDPDSTRRHLSVCHVKTLKMSEDVLCVRHSPDGRLLTVALLDTTVKVFFTDSLKFFLSLYGHKLPVLSMDISSDSSLLATSSADKNIRIWGLDFGDCHKSLFAHDDSVMGIKFVPGTHLMFSCGKDSLVKCWDADTFEHVMTLEGHCGEVWCLAVSHDGSTVVTGSHDYSLRLWEKTDELLILSEERERERETLFEEAVAEGAEPVVAGEEEGAEVSMAGRKTVESMRAAEQMMEGLAVYREEKAKFQEWEEECKVEQREVPHPKPHPLLVAMGDITSERYVLDVVRKIKSSELEEALLVMPFSDVMDFLPLIDKWLKNAWETELACRCLFFLLRIHHHQIVTNHRLLPVMASLKHHTHHSLEALRDMYGFNLAGLQSIRHEMETSGTPVFTDVTEKLQRLRKKKKLTSYKS